MDSVHGLLSEVLISSCIGSERGLRHEYARDKRRWPINRPKVTALEFNPITANALGEAALRAKADIKVPRYAIRKVVGKRAAITLLEVWHF